MLRFLPKHKYCNLLAAFFLLCSYILMFPNTTPSKMPSLLFIRGHYLTYDDSHTDRHKYTRVLHSSWSLEYRARNMWKIFSLVSSEKHVTRENWDKLSVYFSILNDKIDQNTNFAKLPSAKWLFLVQLWILSIKNWKVNT